jgi:hypothetical protein
MQPSDRRVLTGKPVLRLETLRESAQSSARVDKYNDVFLLLIM